MYSMNGGAVGQSKFLSFNANYCFINNPNGGWLILPALFTDVFSKNTVILGDLEPLLKC